MPAEVIIALLLAALLITALMFIVVLVVLMQLMRDVHKFGRQLLKVRRWVKQQDKAIP